MLWFYFSCNIKLNMQLNRIFLPEIVLLVCLIYSSMLGPDPEAFIFCCSVAG